MCTLCFYIPLFPVDDLSTLNLFYLGMTQPFFNSRVFRGLKPCYHTFLKKPLSMNGLFFKQKFNFFLLLS